MYTQAIHGHALNLMFFSRGELGHEISTSNTTVVFVMVLQRPPVLLLVVATCTLHAATGLQLGRGWNYGRVLTEDARLIKSFGGEWIFKTVKDSGFDWVRVPVKWDNHTAHTSPYRVNENFLATVNEIVGWALKHRLKAMVNAHCED